MKKIPLFKVNTNPAIPDLLRPIFESGYIGEGPKVKEFEKAFAEVNNLEGLPPLFVNSCTSAIVLALKTIGVEPGDKVISTAQTCFASNAAILQMFADIVWADIDPINGLIDPLDVARKVTPDVKAIIAVDWGGKFCDYNALKENGIPVIQDAAHDLYIDPANRGDYTCWSFQAIKFLTTVDGGALLPPEDKYLEAKLMRWFGLDRDASASFRCAQDIALPGSKFQQTDVAATIGLANIEIAKKAVELAQKNARYYSENLINPNLIVAPFDPSANYWIYTIRTVDPSRRDALIGYLSERGVESSQVHARNDKHTIFAKYKVNLPNTALFDSSQLAIPNGFWVTERDRKYITKILNEFE